MWLNSLFLISTTYKLHYGIPTRQIVDLLLFRDIWSLPDWLPYRYTMFYLTDIYPVKLPHVPLLSAGMTATVVCSVHRVFRLI